MGMRKVDILRKISKVDDELLALSEKNLKLHPEYLTCKDLKRLLEAFETIHELFLKCAVDKGMDSGWIRRVR